ncbi:hypothetical protein ACFSQ3_02510 [Sphingobacterium corticis]|uniref:DUF4843 domain-containing protein n=1 Tax=Sphingobacterium corticis TaxID=1812823 RepID=A0ABW5NIF1_9SPHI
MAKFYRARQDFKTFSKGIILSKMLVTLLFFMSCDKEVVPEPEFPFDDSYLEGNFGHFGGYLLNSLHFHHKIIETKALNPKFHVFVRSPDSEFFMGQAKNFKVDVFVPDPKSGKSFVVSNKQTDSVANIVYTMETIWKSGEQYNTVYLPDRDRIPLHIQVLNVDQGRFVDLAIKGFLYNQENNADSTFVDVKLRAQHRNDK